MSGALDREIQAMRDFYSAGSDLFFEEKYGFQIEEEEEEEEDSFYPDLDDIAKLSNN